MIEIPPLPDNEYFPYAVKRLEKEYADASRDMQTAYNERDERAKDFMRPWFEVLDAYAKHWGISRWPLIKALMLLDDDARDAEESEDGEES